MLVERFAQNPLITPQDVLPSRDDYEVVCVFNPGAIKYKDEIILLLRVAERPKDKSPNEQIAPILNPATGRIEHFRVKNDDPDVQIPDSRSFYYKGKMHLTSISHLRIARSKDGINFTVDPKPAVIPELESETFGLEDPRITQIDDTFYITYKSVSQIGICTSLLSTKDFRSFNRHGIIFCPENLDVAIFPERINGLYYTLTRPVPMYIGPRAIWLASSPDLINWGSHKPILLPREGTFDGGKVGASCVPVKTNQGWLEIYHGSNENDKYSLAAALLDINDPSKVLARSKQPLMQPHADYEINGFYGNVVFACGAITYENGDIIIYYGAADTCTAAAKTNIKKVLNTLG